MNNPVELTKTKQAVILNGEVALEVGDVAHLTSLLSIHSFRLSGGDTGAWRENRYQVDVFLAANDLGVKERLNFARSKYIRHVYVKRAGVLLGAVVGPDEGNLVDEITACLRPV